MAEPRIIIAFDGTSASGKGTLAKLLANKLNYYHLNSGMIFRKIAYLYLNKNPLNFSTLNHIYGAFNFSKIDNLEMFSETVSNTASKIALIEKVREFAVFQQRLIASNKDAIVVDGRDIGTVVFPNAAFKFFFDANIEVRAQRRFNQLQKNGKGITLSQVLNNLRQRDIRDKNRPIGPLIRNHDYIAMDTTLSSIDKILETILTKISNKI